MKWRIKPGTGKTIADLKEAIKNIPDHAYVYAYEGEFTGLVILDPNHRIPASPHAEIELREPDYERVADDS